MANILKYVLRKTKSDNIIGWVNGVLETAKKAKPRKNEIIIACNEIREVVFTYNDKSKFIKRAQDKKD